MPKPKMRNYRAGEAAAYAHHKLDGHFCRVSVSEAGILRAVTSLDTDITDKLPKITLGNVQRNATPGSVLLGELHCEGDGHRASDVKTAIKHGWESLRFTCFALENMPEDMPLEELDDWCTMRGIRFAQYDVLHDGWRKRDLMQRAKELGIEGYVMKDGNLLNWRKLKLEQTCDLVVLDKQPGVGKYLGLVGSLIVGLPGGRVLANCSGMTDDERRRITETWPESLGRVIEVEYQYVGSGGKLRHPRFLRFRDDKLPHECTCDQFT